MGYFFTFYKTFRLYFLLIRISCCTYFEDMQKWILHSTYLVCFWVQFSKRVVTGGGQGSNCPPKFWQNRGRTTLLPHYYLPPDKLGFRFIEENVIELDEPVKDDWTTVLRHINADQCQSHDQTVMKNKKYSSIDMNHLELILIKYKANKFNLK